MAGGFIQFAAFLKGTTFAEGAGGFRGVRRFFLILPTLGCFAALVAGGQPVGQQDQAAEL